MSYECQTCHAVEETSEELCRPVEDKGDCAAYTELHQNLRDACGPVKSRMEYSCQGCGRLSAVSEEVCLPATITF